VINAMASTSGMDMTGKVPRPSTRSGVVRVCVVDSKESAARSLRQRLNEFGYNGTFKRKNADGDSHGRSRSCS